MIKVNRFVLVTCNGGLHSSHILMQNDVPFLAIGYGPGTSPSDPATRDFRGYAIHVTIGNSKDDWQRYLAPSQFVMPCNIIMLFRDLELIRQAIMRGDDLLEDGIDVVLISIELGPAAIVPLYQTEAPTTYFSSTKVQKELLEPFRRRIRDGSNVDISGIVDESLVQSALKDLARDKFDDLDDLIESWRARVAQGTKLCERGHPDGMAHWLKVIKEIMIAVDGPMWTRVVEKGGSPFVGKVAELYYTTNFHIVAYFLLRLEEGGRDAIASIRYAYENVKRGEEAEYWGIEHSWKLSPAQHMDKIFYYAKFCRLWGVPTLIPAAVHWIDQLVHLFPSNPEFLDEKRKIEAWKRSAGPVGESVFNAMMNGLEL
ncbi:hypothetical protein AA0111_g1808 [Alternaria arborescens]|uniref:hypothetical protein n=1 Tax=Alternaria arborescens TaxID=156630 RepID=UPI00107518E2|nr:hypothetical protein AA0111_g1808 [Alternaria arborescens]RYO39196.1 hypothetical protein AA0111_g1808 [Alternaria arborescens]